jgi:hypothetical protein
MSRWGDPLRSESSGGGNEGHLVRRSRRDTHGERKTRAVCQCPAMPMSLEPLPRMVFPTHLLFFRHHEEAIDEALGQIELAALLQVLGEGFQHPFECAVAHLPLAAAMGGLVRRILLRQVGPLGLVRTVHEMPSSISRPLRHGQPRPSARRGIWPISDSSTFYCSLIRSMAAAPSCRMHHLFLRSLV